MHIRKSAIVTLFSVTVSTTMPSFAQNTALPTQGHQKMTDTIAQSSTELVSPDARFERGLQRLGEVTQSDGQAVVDRLSQTSPDFARYVIEYPYGDVFSRPGLTDRDRELATVSALISMGFAKPELKVHMHGALNVGVTEDELKEVVILMSVYAGFPAAIHGIRALEEVIAERAARE